MNLLDKIYLVIYWVVNKKLNQHNTAIWVLDTLLLPILTGILFFVFTLFLWLLSFDVDLKFLIAISTVVSFLLSGWLIKRYFGGKKQKQIIENNKKPGIYRYFVMLFVVLISISMMIFFALLAGIFLN